MRSLWKSLIGVMALALVLSSTPGRAQENEEMALPANESEIPAAPQTKPPTSTKAKPTVTEDIEPAAPLGSPNAPNKSSSSSAMEDSEPVFRDSRSLLMNARFDAQYLAGNPIQQGFSIPSLRLSASGEVGSVLDYRLSFGETREFSSLQLPQILPVEAYIDVLSSRSLEDRHLRWRFGMFTPSYNPWWTPDLTYLPFPDYEVVQRELFLFRDIGTELVYTPVTHLEFSLGFFNGNGIFSLNTNNSRAITFQVKGTIPAAYGKLVLGASGYATTQSSAGSVNYRENYLGNVFSLWEDPSFTLGVECFGGTLTDSTRSLSPFGVAAWTSFRLAEATRFFLRAEYLSKPPSGTKELEHLELGPVLSITRSLQVFVIYDYLNDVAPATNQFMFRMRLVI